MGRGFYIFALALFSLTAFGQESRLNIGENPKLPVLSSNLGTFVKPISSEVNLNRNSAVSDFYKALLISPTKKPEAKSVKAASFENKEMADFMYNDANISVSSVYPNPANDVAKISYQIKNRRSKAILTVHNIVGGQLTSTTLDPFEKELSISTRTWDNGIYFYQLIVDGKKVATKKMLVRHN